MAPRPIWRGHLRLALVSCPVALYSAKHDRATIRFNLINPATGHRIRMVTVDAETDEEVQRRNLVKGYEFRKNQYLLLTDDDLASVKVESSSVMSVEKFVPGEAIDPVYYDTPYYLAPDGEAGRDVYQVIREAIRRTGRVALSRVVIGQRERVVAVRPFGDGLAAHTLSEQGDLNDAKGLFDEPQPVDEEMVKLATQLVDRQTAAYDPVDIEDRYEARLRALIDAKLKGKGLDQEADVVPAAGNVVDLMAALKRSLAQQKPPAEPKASKPGGRKPAAHRRKRA
jgi:DNA end-binding protein Ku